MNPLNYIGDCSYIRKKTYLRSAMPQQKINWFCYVHHREGCLFTLLISIPSSMILHQKSVHRATPSVSIYNLFDFLHQVWHAHLTKKHNYYYYLLWSRLAYNVYTMSIALIFLFFHKKWIRWVDWTWYKKSQINYKLGRREYLFMRKNIYDGVLFFLKVFTLVTKI